MPMLGAITPLLILASTQGVSASTADVASVARPAAVDDAPGIVCVAVEALRGVCRFASVVASTGAGRAQHTAPPADQSGDIVVTAEKNSRAIDPLREVNAKLFELVNAVDEAVVGPVALTYKRAVPKPLRDGIRNFLNNLHEPVVALNFLIQLKPSKAVETVGRFGLNSSAGVAGVFDFARRRPVNLPRRRNGFADSMGYYGVKPGPYLFLPLIGPTTVRDLVGGTVDGFVLPFAVGSPLNRVTYTLPTGVLRGLDRRAEFDADLAAMRDSGDDLYTIRRRTYLSQREAEIDALHGRAVHIR